MKITIDSDKFFKRIEGLSLPEVGAVITLMLMEEVTTQELVERTVGKALDEDQKRRVCELFGIDYTASATLWPSFDDFWNLYDKKMDRAKCEQKWSRLKQKEREQLMAALPAYITSTPDKQYRKHPATYLNNKSWLNEIITRQSSIPSLDELAHAVKRAGHHPGAERR